MTTLYEKLLADFSIHPVKIREIAAREGVSIRTIYNYYKKFKENVSVDQIRPKGRPKKLSKADNRVISQLKRHRLSITSHEIATYLAEAKKISISPCTVTRFLNDQNWIFTKPAYSFNLTEAQKANRVAWAREHIDFDFKKVIFSDESSFQIQPCSSRIWVKNRTTSKLKQSKFPVRLMCWGAFYYGKRFELEFPVGSINSEKYISVVSTSLIPFLKKRVNGQMIFQQENAPCHKSRVALGFFDENNVNLLEWPANSPDLNPIENLWSIIKRRVAKRSAKNRDELQNFIIEEWRGIDAEILKNLIDSMPRRLQLVIEKNGEEIGY